MFLQKKKRAWYWGVIALFFALRMLFRVARFFMNAADRQARMGIHLKERRLGRAGRNR